MCMGVRAWQNMRAGAALLRRGRRRPLWALGRVCTTQPGVSCGVCHKCRASAESRRCSGCVGGIARGIEVLRVHGVGRRGGGTRRCVLVCATQSGAGCGAQFCEEREPWGRWSWVRGGGGGAAGSCAGGGLHGCASSCVRDRRARAPRLRVCLGLSTFVSATIITPEVWARPCTRLSFVRGGGDAPLGTRGGMCPPPLPGKSG